MNTLQFEKELAEQYKYKKLPVDKSAEYQKFYLENIPLFLNINGGGKLYTLNSSLICNNYDRIVIGDYGAFIEFTNPASPFVIENGQEYRYEERYKYCKYYWLTIPDNSHIKIYLQRYPVTYADYLPGKYYVSVHEVSST